MYYNPIFIAGKVEGLRKAHVLETDPDADFPLELDNGEYIPKDTTVKRIKEYRNGTLLEHPGMCFLQAIRLDIVRPLDINTIHLASLQGFLDRSRTFG
jgi:hypothetical protein